MIVTSEKIKEKFNPPFLIIDIKKSHIDARNDKTMYCAPSLLNKAYKNYLIVDSKGLGFETKKANKASGLKLLTSFKYISPMVEINLETKEGIKEFSLLEIKEKLIKTINRKPKLWLSLDTIEGLEERIIRAGSFTQLMAIFNLKINEG